MNTEFPDPWQTAARLPGRLLNGRPGRVAARAAVTAGIATATALLIPGTPAAPADITAALLWLALTSPPELAPPPAETR